MLTLDMSRGSHMCEFQSLGVYPGVELGGRIFHFMCQTVFKVVVLIHISNAMCESVLIIEQWCVCYAPHSILQGLQNRAG